MPNVADSGPEAGAGKSKDGDASVSGKQRVHPGTQARGRGGQYWLQHLIAAGN